MAISTFSEATFGKPLRDGYNVIGGDALLRNPVGPPFNYLAYDENASMTVQLRWRFTFAQWQSFLSFYETDAVFGAKRFIITLWLEDAYVDVYAKFMGAYSTKMIGLDYIVSAKLEVEVDKSPP